ncbi:MAG: hypothetical protein JW818_02050 [Pirellulales bacterium]|nr:hypothetical protein [Pirellulales bacterium]
MDRGVKLVLSSAVLLAGVLGAWAYRHGGSKPPAVEPTPTGPALVLREEPAATAPRTEPYQNGPTAQPSRAAVRPVLPELTVRQRLDADCLPPSLPVAYPSENAPAASPIVSNHASQAEPVQRIHRIVDGDTLPALAEHYLGDRARYLEIFRANRDVLDDPELLPRGVDLKIPPPGLPPSPVLHERKLVPIHRPNQ